MTNSLRGAPESGTLESPDPSRGTPPFATSQLDWVAPQASPGLVATAVTTAALCSSPFTPPMVQDTVVVALWPTSGCTATEQVPSTLFVCGSVMANATVEGALAAFFPPRFLIEAATRHGEVQPEVSTETTV